LAAGISLVAGESTLGKGVGGSFFAGLGFGSTGTFAAADLGGAIGSFGTPNARMSGSASIKYTFLGGSGDAPNLNDPFDAASRNMPYLTGQTPTDIFYPGPFGNSTTLNPNYNWNHPSSGGIFGSRNPADRQGPINAPYDNGGGPGNEFYTPPSPHYNSETYNHSMYKPPTPAYDSSSYNHSTYTPPGPSPSHDPNTGSPDPVQVLRYVPQYDGNFLYGYRWKYFDSPDNNPSQNGPRNGQGNDYGNNAGLSPRNGPYDNGGGPGTNFSPSSGYTTSSPTNTGFGGPHPIALDLAGLGIVINEVTRSNTFIDADGTGLLHRTAWAGVGNGVLFYDPKSLGVIAEKSQYVFTEWDPTAKGDLEALRNVFDDNGDGVLDASDAKFALFKVEVTNADGSTTVMTLTQLGITSINLIGDQTHITYSDGSEIMGQTTFTRTVGGVTTTGTVANTILATENQGYAVTNTVTTDASLNRVVTNTAYASDGSIANTTTSTTSADGHSVTINYDSNGDGVTDSQKTIITTVDAGGTRTETLTNRDGGGRLINVIETISSSDGRSVTINRDFMGGGWYDKTETRTTFADGHRTVVVTDKAIDGSEVHQSTTTVSIDGLTRTVATDLDSNLTADRIATYALVNNGDGSRVETMSDTSNNGSLLASSVMTTSANGRIQTTTSDLDGNGTTDRTVASTITVNADNSTNAVTTTTNGNGSLRNTVTVAQSADSQSSTTTTDFNGDGVIDLKTVDIMVINADTSRDHTVSLSNTDDTLRSRVTTHINVDRISKTTTVDQDGNGTIDSAETVTVSVAGIRTVSTSNYAADGSLINGSVATTSANGLSTTTIIDRDGNGFGDTGITEVTVKNPDGTAVRTMTTFIDDGSTVERTVQTVSANGLTVTIQSDIDGVNGFDYSEVDIREVFGDLSTRNSMTSYNANGTLRDQMITNGNADRRSVMTTMDSNGDGAIDQTETIVKSLNGTTTHTVSNTNINGSTIDQMVSIASANGLSVTSKLDSDGNGTLDQIKTDVKTYNIDGSTTETMDVRNNDTSLLSKEIIATSGNGLSQTMQIDMNGDGVYDVVTTDVKVLNTNGSVTETVSNKNALNGLTSQTIVTTSASGLSTSTARDINGDGVTDFTTNDTVQLNANGSQTHTVQVLNGNGSLRSSEVTLTSDDHRSIAITRDTNGNSIANETETITVYATGRTEDRVSNFSETGQLQSRTTTVTEANGLGKTILYDYDGNGFDNAAVTDFTIFNLNGSQTETVTKLNDDIIGYRQVTTKSATGLLTTVQTDTYGFGWYDTTTTDNVQLLATGARVETISTSNNDMSLRGQTITTINSDRLTTTITRDVTGDTVSDQTEVRSEGVDGTVTDVISSFTTSGVLTSRFTTTASANGLVTTYTDDRNGDSVIDLSTLSTTVLNADGSRTTTVIDRGVGNVLLDQHVTTVSDDGYTITMQEDRNGDGLNELLSTNNTAFNIDGSRTITITVTNGAGALRDSVTSTVSANGLTSLRTMDLNGDGTIDVSVNFAELGDSSSIDTTNFKRLTGATYQVDQRTVSADGKTVVFAQDLNGDGTIDRAHTTIVDLNNNMDHTYKDLNVSGVATKQISVQTSATSLPGTAFDVNADGTIDFLRTEGKSYLSRVDSLDYDIQGGQTLDYLKLSDASNHQFYVENHITDSNGSHWSTTIDFLGDGIADEVIETFVVINMDGSIITRTDTRPADAPYNYARTETVTSANGLNIQTTIDYDGNLTFNRSTDRTISIVIGVDGSQVTTNTELITSGAQTSQLVTSTSSDGLRVTATFSNGTSQLIEYATNAMGSYTWTETTSTSLKVATHTYDVAGIDVWTLAVSGTSYSAALDTASEANLTSIAQRLFDTILDRNMYVAEREGLVQYINDGTLDHVQLVTAIVGSVEFSSKYGSLSDAEFLVQVYQNAFGRSPMLGEFQSLLTSLSSGANTRTSIVLTLSESIEHILAGNDHIQTNNTDLNIGGLNTTHAIDHTYDRVFAGNYVKLIYDALFDRDPTATELDNGSVYILGGLGTEAALANTLRLSSEFTTRYGTLSNADYVTQLYINTLGKLPTPGESTIWVSLLNTNAINQADLARTFAVSIEHQVTQNIHGGLDHAPLVAVPLPDRFSPEDTAINFTLPANSFTDEDGDSLIYTATLFNGEALPSWLIFHAVTQTFNGIPPLDFNHSNELLYIKVTASDGTLSKSDVFKLDITPINDAPVAAPIVLTEIAVNSGVHTITSEELLAGVTEVDSFELTITALTIASGGGSLVNNGNGTWSYTPALNDDTSVTFNYTVSDESLTASSTAYLDITSSNVGPIVAVTLPDQSSLEDTVFSFTIPVGSFTDADSAVLSYSATLASGVVLPSWLSFNAITQTFSGTPPLNFNGSLDVKVTASDGSLSVSDIFTLTISPVNDAPVVVTLLADQSSAEDTALSFTIPMGSFTDVDNAILTYRATLASGVILPSWLSFNATTQTFTGTPPLNFNGSLDVKVTASDGSLSASDVFTLIITAVNDAPVTAGDGPLPLLYNTALTITAASLLANDTDVDGDQLGISAVANPYHGAVSILPNGDVSFVPAADYIGPASFTYTVSDGAGGTSTATVFITVQGVAGQVITGTSANNVLTGTAGDDTIYGLAGNDTLNGAGGVDTLVGGAGNDTYVVDSVGDVATELAGEGTDLVKASVSWTMAANIENLTLTGTANINGTGNSLANVFTGNAGNNILNGMGGVDTLVGGLGDDTYVVDVVGVITTEAATAGTDTVQSSVNWTLATNLENLTLTGNASINGTGNTLANVITGNSAYNILSGGTGADIMIGGLGNDTYVVDNVGDVATENAGEGTDLMQSSVTWTLGNNIENLTLTGTGSINATGNTLDNILNGNAGGNILSGGSGADTMIGGAGNDTYVVDNAGDVTTELAAGGTDLVQSSISWTLVSETENLTLTGAANINGTGNASVNVITGNGGNNLLNGMGGLDTLAGGLGDDTYVIDNLGVVTTEAATAGTDLVLSSVSWTLATNFENLTLTGSAAIDATGNTVANLIAGNANNNTLNGGTGADTLIGGLGDDTYVVDNVGDITTENIGEGTDLVQSTITWVLANNIENLTLAGTTAINGTGNALDNIINGNTGNNILNGGIGADILIGGLGNDTYVVDNVGDVITELAAGGTDLVQSSISWALATETENLTLTGAANINGTGNAAVNVITGNAGNNILNGLGGLDTLVGGLGDDTYVVDVVGIIITEAASAGTDTVQSSVNWTLATNLENLTLTGNAATNGTGNTLANLITGNSADNILSGGTGADTMIGGSGNDTYLVDNAGDVTTELASAGTDLVQSSVTWTLASNLENLTLTGTTAINGTGNTLDNVLTGNSGVNVLNGGSGADTLIGAAGNDTLTGGLGNDTFNFATAFGKDIITDFAAGTGVTDIINLSLGTAFDTYAEVMAVATQMGANTVFTFNAADTITLTGVFKTALVLDDFMFT
jgi:Ca2+-binding RTX toxin-like protein